MTGLTVGCFPLAEDSPRSLESQASSLQRGPVWKLILDHRTPRALHQVSRKLNLNVTDFGSETFHTASRILRPCHFVSTLCAASHSLRLAIMPASQTISPPANASKLIPPIQFLAVPVINQEIMPRIPPTPKNQTITCLFDFIMLLGRAEREPANRPISR